MSYGNTEREFREGRTEHGNKTIIINIVKRDEEVKERLYIRYMQRKSNWDKYKQWKRGRKILEMVERLLKASDIKGRQVTIRK